MNVVTIEDWAIIGLPYDRYKPPESKKLHLLGKVFGHPKHEDGKSVLTSTVMHADGRVIFTRNTKYHLGKAGEGYREWYMDKYSKELNEDSPFSD